MNYYLGLDLSTQQLKCTVINDKHDIIFEHAICFDRDLPEFGTVNGAIIHGNHVTSPTRMWVKSLDLLLHHLKDKPFTKHIRAISGAGQQHGSIFWSAQGISKIASLDASQDLDEQLGNESFTISQSPIWQDSSTTRECRALESSLGGPQALADLTGSRAYERFTGNQIAKMYHDQRSAYDATTHISLVSSFLATLLLGRLAPVDAADGSGMNLMNIWTRHWQDDILDFCGGPTLRDKLGDDPVSGGANLGSLHPYFSQRYGFDPACRVVQFTGDNTATLLSMHLKQGDCVVSLGTSDTALVYVKDPKPTTEAHLLAHPIDSSGYMGMLCYKNGSLARQHIRDLYAEGSWDTFNAHLQTSSDPACYGFYYWMKEIIPFAKGIHRFEHGQEVDEFSSPTTNIRAIVESQCLSMRVRLGRMMPLTSLRRIIAAGGASANDSLLQVLSDVMGLSVYRQRGVNGASYGCALMAKYAIYKDSLSFDDMIERQHPIEPELVCEPNKTQTSMYEGRLEEFVRLEALASQEVTSTTI